MIRYALACNADHAFEAWFSNSAAYDTQARQGEVECPVCGSRRIRKQITAPAIHAGGRETSRASRDVERLQRDPEAMAAHIAGEIRQHIARTHEYVGDRFADEARAMHSGEKDPRSVWGEVTPHAARELAEEGVPAMPLPRPFAPDPPRRREKLN